MASLTCHLCCPHPTPHQNLVARARKPGSLLSLLLSRVQAGRLLGKADFDPQAPPPDVARHAALCAISATALKPCAQVGSRRDGVRVGWGVGVRGAL